ncbi:MAG TPA: glycosyltransferase [Nitrososphaeraceae archaeon]|jgi:hyaluronan synthase|nr:glycosyltransferase [Nitrososphaeraceae archaeon]
MTLQEQTSRYSEVEKSKWIARVLMVIAVGCVLAAKVYFTISLVDPFIGIYSLLTSFVLLCILTLSYFKYKDPYLSAKNVDVSNGPLISIVVPAKNEEKNIRNCVQSCLNQTYMNKEIIVVNDGSTDKTGEVLDEMRKENRTTNFRILHLSKSVGKKKAVEAASEIARGEIYAFMDSDCDMAFDAVEKAAKIFHSDRKLGALTCHGRVRDAQRGNTIERFQQVYIDISCRSIKAAESSFKSVTCCSGSLSFYRRVAIQDFIHEWANDRFLGIDFKFCTDRRMTAHILGTRTTLDSSSDKKQREHMPILQTGGDDIETMKKSLDPDVEFSDRPIKWNVEYSNSIKVNVGVPKTFESLAKQQIRWRKSFIRSLFATGGIYWKRPSFIALLYYIQIAMKLIRPYVLFYTIAILPIKGDFTSVLFWIAGVMFTGMIYAVEYRLRNPDDGLWLYRPPFTFITTFVYTWFLIYSAFTIRNKSWR